jgi:DNA polymerase V
MNHPLFSTVSAGNPSPTDEAGENFDVSTYLVRRPEDGFFVEVSGNSMIGRGINHGDILVVDKSREPVSGSVVVARLDDGYTVKTFKPGSGRLRLVPANPSYPTLEPSEDCALVGVATFVIHKL